MTPTSDFSIPARLTVRRLLIRLAALFLLALLGSTAAAAEKRRAFVTSIEGTGDLSTWPGAVGANALEMADAICQERAQLGGRPNFSAYKAWLSTSSTDAYCHLQGLSGKKATNCDGSIRPGGGPWFLANGITSFSGTLDELVGPEAVIYRPVLLDEYLFEGSGKKVWTATAPDGTYASAGFNGVPSCEDWTYGVGAKSGIYGLADHSAVHWTDYFSQQCNNTASLLCLESGTGDATSLGWSPGAIAFVTSATGTGNLSSWPQAHGLEGLEAGDEICRDHALKAGLPQPESFVAWLSLWSGIHAKDRVDITATIRRLDGFTFANNEADMLDGSVPNSLHVDEEGRYISETPEVWTGTFFNGNAKTPNCEGWTSASYDGYGTIGQASAARSSLWTEATVQLCYKQARLYCFTNVVTTELPMFADGFDIGTTGRWSASVP